MSKDNAVEFGWSEVKHGEDLYDAVLVSEFPNDEAAAPVTLTARRAYRV
jgi:hypothetical protein